MTLEDLAGATLNAVHEAGFSRAALVGHSMGGVTITEAAIAAPDVVGHLVYVSSAVPPEGGTIADTLPGPARWLVRRQARRSAGAGGGGSLPEPLARWMFCNDLDAERTRWVLDRLGPEDPSLVVTPVSRHGLDPAIPRTYVRLRRDHSIPPRRQARMIANLGGAQERWLDAGHDAMVSRPEELAAVLEDAVA